jgi:ribulose 1,5-bisphosphate synthetase/thiazole synthase
LQSWHAPSDKIVRIAHILIEFRTEWAGEARKIRRIYSSKIAGTRECAPKRDETKMNGGASNILNMASAMPPVRSGDYFDIVVAGGGASGLMAAVSAARKGARVLVVESAGCFGGAATSAMVAQWLGFYNGETCAVGGLPIEFAERVVAREGARGFENYVLAEATAHPLQLKRLPFNPEVVKLVADELVLESGASALLHARIAGVTSAGDRITGIEIETSGGRIEVRATCFVDATGDAVVGRLAGAPLKGVEPGQHRMGMSLVFRLSHVDIATFRALTRAEKRAIALEGIAAGELFWDVLSVSPVGTSDAICLMSHLDGLDSLDASDLTRAELIGRYQVGRIAGFLKRRMPGFHASELAAIASHIGVRESVRLEGDYLLTEQDVVTAQSFDDSIALGCGPLDVHEEGGKLRLFMPAQPFEIPMRTMTCAAVRNLIVTGRAISATREANGAIRHQATAMALGQAAGHIAALAGATQGEGRAVPAFMIQESLAAVGAIPSRGHLPIVAATG